jgi:hypothetical protein
MQPATNIRRESKTSNENTDDTEVSPPSYPSVIYKLKNYSSENYDDFPPPPPPPDYSDANNPSVVYINNYPGPPLTDGIVQIVTSNNIPINDEVAMRNSLSKRTRIYLIINGIITIVFGFTIIGIQIGLLASHSIVYYYYGFWAGCIIISIGISTILFTNRYRTYDLTKYFRSFLLQTVFVAVVFGFGIIIILTDTCVDNDSDFDGNDDSCKNSYKILNGFLIAMIALTFLQSIINTIIMAILKRRYFINSNVVS